MAPGFPTGLRGGNTGGVKESGKEKPSWPFPLNMKLGDGRSEILEQPQEGNKEKIEKLRQCQ